MKTKKTIFILVLVLAGLCLFSSEIYSQQSAHQLFEEAIYLEEAKGDLQEAINLYKQISETRDADQSIKAKALLHTGMCYEKLGSEQARQIYRDVISRYSEQAPEVALARERISRLDANLVELNMKAETHMKQGNELFNRWAYEDAIREYENALKLKPNTLLAMNAQYWIGQSLFKAGKYDASLATFTDLIEKNPHSTIAPVTELMLSQVQYAMEHHENPGTITLNSDENTLVDPETGITYRKIKTFTGKNDVIDWPPFASLSPNGKFLLQDNSIVPMDGSDSFEFTDMQAGGSVWSPDGNTLAFTLGDSSIYIVSVSPETGHATGAPQKILEEKNHELAEVNWSPDSKKLFFHMMNVQEEEYPRIFSLSISDKETKSLAKVNFPQFNPACSPDGSTIAFNGPFSSLWLCPETGGDARELIDDKHTKPHWTPDGKWVFSDETRKGWGRSLNFIQISDGKEFKLTPPVKTGTFASFSPEGDRILFYRSSYRLMWGMKVASALGGPSYEPVAHLPVYGAQWSENSNLIIVQGEKHNKMDEGDAAIRIVPISGGESFLLNMNVDVTGKLFAYCVTPDQKRILFVTKTDGDETDDFYMAPISIEEAKITGPATLIIENWNRGGASNTKLSMSHDGTKLAIVHNENIWIYNMDTKELNQITDTPENKKWVAWSPDGTMLSYQVFPEIPEFKQRSQIISSKDGKSIKTIEDYLLWPYGWVPDSKSIVYEQRDGKIVIHNIQSDEIKILIDPKSYMLRWIPSYYWSPDGKNLLLNARKESEPDQYYLYKMSVEGGELTEIATDDLNYKYDFSWSPDGKWICYCYMEGEKVRPESTLWEADYQEILEKLVAQ